MDLSNKPNEADLKELERLCEKRRESLAKERGMKFLADKQYVPIASISIKEPIKKERSILDGLDLSKIPLGMAMAINEALMEEAWERRNREKAYEKK
jgi:hypothetical protein